MTGACDDCLRRSWLLQQVGARVEAERSAGRPLTGLLARPDAELAAVAGDAADPGGWDAEVARAAVAAAGLRTTCRHRPDFPPGLADLPDPPAALHVAGGGERMADLLLHDARCAAIVGARRASAYGLEVARALGRGLSAAGVTVVSGMALGVDSAAHEGALAAGGRTVAVLAGGADRAYPASRRALHARLRREAVALSEVPPGARPWRWSFPARNRLIAALADVTVVVEGGERSGSLITATLATDLGREVGAVPGRVTSPLAAGPNGLIASGAHLVRDASDVLDLLFGAQPRAAPAAAGRCVQPVTTGAGLPSPVGDVLRAVGEGHDSLAALAAAGIPPDRAAAALAELELRGLVRRTHAGRFLPSVA